jgi:hypothetical protein
MERMYAVSPRRITPIVVGDAIRRGEMASTRREDHEVSMLALHLLQNYMVYYINTLMISPDRPLRGAQQPVGAGWRPSATDSLLSFNTPRHYIHL